MKLKYILTSLLASTMLLPACVEVDDLNYTGSVGAKELSIKGFLVNGYSEEIPTEIDEEAGIIIVKVPYYISDTERIMGDLSQMKLEAQLPTGYTFSPSLSGIHDLTEGFRTNLLDTKGNAKSYTIKAEYVKNSEAKVLDVSFEKAPQAISVVKHPESEGEHGSITVYKTTSSLDGALGSALVSVSPWATITCEYYNQEEGTVDFNYMPLIKITSQDGSATSYYDVVVETPGIKDFGAGYIGSLWAKQLYTDNDEGWEKHANTSLAIVDDYLIVSNANNFKQMLVFDRFSGKRLQDVSVNCDGIPGDRIIYAIDNDDANHMVAVTYTGTLWMTGSEATTDPAVLIYVWKDGITSKPTCVLNANKAGSYFTSVPSLTNSADLFENISCAGDMVSGNAVITNVYRGHYGGVMLLPFVNGKPDGNCVYEGDAGVYASTWDSSNAVPLTTSAPWSYIVHSGNGRGVVSYVPAGTGKRAVVFNKPSGHWWGAGQPTANWSGSSLAVDYIEFNGMCLLAAINGNNTQGLPEYNRLYVSDITANPLAGSFSEGFLFDSREGNNLGDANNGGPKGTGYGVTGMTSKYSYQSGRIVLGDDFASFNRAMGSVRFARSIDGSAVQVYMLVPDHGVIAYEITRYDI